jgi:hypothetical protein
VRDARREGQRARIRAAADQAGHRLLTPATGNRVSPENRQDLAALRVVVRNGVSRDLADLLVDDLRRHVAWFSRLTAPLPPTDANPGFSHWRGSRSPRRITLRR